MVIQLVKRAGARRPCEAGGYREGLGPRAASAEGAARESVMTVRGHGHPRRQRRPAALIGGALLPVDARHAALRRSLGHRAWRHPSRSPSPTCAIATSLVAESSRNGAGRIHITARRSSPYRFHLRLERDGQNLVGVWAARQTDVDGPGGHRASTQFSATLGLPGSSPCSTLGSEPIVLPAGSQWVSQVLKRLIKEDEGFSDDGPDVRDQERKLGDWSRHDPHPSLLRRASIPEKRCPFPGSPEGRTPVEGRPPEALELTPGA